MKKLLLIMFLISSLNAQTAKLQWSANPETDLAGYKVYFGENSVQNSVDVGNVTNHEIEVTPGTWVFAVSAYDFAGNESGLSESIFLEVQEARKPAQPNFEIDTTQVSMDADTAIVKSSLPIRIIVKHYWEDETRFEIGLLDSIRIQLHNRNTGVFSLLTYVFGDSSIIKMIKDEGTYDIKIFSYKDGQESDPSFARYYRIDGLIEEELYLILEL